jgi:uncharacterized protein
MGRRAIRETTPAPSQAPAAAHHIAQRVVTQSPGALVRNITIALIFGLLICPRMSRADAPVEDSHARAATEFLMVMNVEKQMAVGSEVMTDQLIRQNPMLGPYKDVLLKWAASTMRWDTLGSQLVALYEESFTESELRDMTAFYETPTGQKALSTLQELANRMAALATTVAKEHAPELETMIRARAAEIEKLTAKP